MGSLLLDSIHQPSDLKQLDHQQIVQLCEEIRHFYWKTFQKRAATWLQILAPWN